MIDCHDFAVNGCHDDKEPLLLSKLEDVPTDGICQKFCQVTVHGCNSFVYKKESKICYLNKQRSEQRVKECTSRVGPKEPDISTCHKSSNPCDVSELELNWIY